MEKYNFIMPKTNILETEFFKNLEHVSGKIGESPTLYLLNCPGGLELFLKNISNDGEFPVQMDCAIFSQFVCYYESDPNLDKYIFTIGAPINALSIFLINPKICYLRPTHDDSFTYLQKSSCDSKGQFLIKRSEDLYYGLSSDGPITQTLNEWISLLKNDCEEWLEVSPKNSYETSLKGLIKCLILMNKLDTWHIEKDLYIGDLTC